MRAQTEIVYMSENELPIKIKLTDSFQETISAIPHLHKEIELILVLKGTMDFHFENRNVILCEGDLIFINTSIVHSTQLVEDQYTKILLLQFDPNIIYNSSHFSELKYLVPFMHNHSKKFHIFHSCTTACAEISALMQGIFKEFGNKAVAYEISVKSMLYAIFTVLYRNDALNFECILINKEGQDAIWRIKKVLEYIDKNYMHEITVEDCAKILDLNYHYFCRIFRRATGRSFTEYLNFVRISSAERLIVCTQKSFTEIIMETGFSSISYFNKVFKKAKGLSPSSYRQRAAISSQ